MNEHKHCAEPKMCCQRLPLPWNPPAEVCLTSRGSEGASIRLRRRVNDLNHEQISPMQPVTVEGAKIVLMDDFGAHTPQKAGFAVKADHSPCHFRIGLFQDTLQSECGVIKDHVQRQTDTVR